MKVVSPDWVVDSVEANLRLDEGKYHPSKLRQQGEVTEDHHVPMESCNGAVPVEEIPLHPVGVSTRTLTVPKSDATPTEATPTEVNDEAGNSSRVLVTEVSIPEATPIAAQQVPEPSETAAPIRTESPDDEIATPPTTPAYDQLLDGVVLHFTDYQEHVEADTLEKWKVVSELEFFLNRWHNDQASLGQRGGLS